jgi:choline dehydrogenase-like flavoprotein
MQVQFAAGAQQVMRVQELAGLYATWSEAGAAVQAIPMTRLLTKAIRTHVMGGCGLAGDRRLGVTRPDRVHWQIGKHSIHDGSLFPTSIGANPQLSTYGVVNKLAQRLVRHLGVTPVVLA